MADARDDRSDARPDPSGASTGDPLRRKGEADAWNALSLVISGMLLWGGLGWLAGRWLHAPALVGVGLMVGTAGGLVLVWLRYGRST